MEQERQSESAYSAIVFLENQVDEMSARMKNLEYDLAEMTVGNNQLQERVKALANRTPAWPKDYRPHRSNKHNRER